CGYLLVLFFFFQAEDGIRGFHVTGVQTCALPISIQDRSAWQSFAGTDGEAPVWSDDVADRQPVLHDERRVYPTLTVDGPWDSTRSEERRVGKAWKCPGCAGLDGAPDDGDRRVAEL